MPAYARRQIVDESVVGVYHCMARCVRRAFLCGVDRYSGRNFDHRKTWVRQRLEELAHTNHYGATPSVCLRSGTAKF